MFSSVPYTMGCSNCNKKSMFHSQEAIAEMISRSLPQTILYMLKNTHIIVEESIKKCYLKLKN